MPKQLARLCRRLLFRWRRDQLHRDLTEELDFHLQQKQAEHGDPQEMGNITIAKENCHDTWSFMTLERFLQDLRFAFRMYARSPVFTGISVLSLALGIGGNAAMFTLVNTLLVRPLPYAQPDRLLRITGIYPRAAVPFFEQRSHTMDIAAVSQGSEFNLTGQGSAMRVTGSFASPNFLSVLGTSVARGRSFLPGEQSPGRDRVVILSHSLWKDRFAADPSVLGRVIRLNDVDREIVGIMSPNFSYPSSKVELWIPMRLDPSNFLEYWGSEFVPLIARLHPGANLAAAQSEVRALVPAFRPTFPYPMARDFNADSTAIPLQQDIVGDVRGKLIILLCSVGFVLLIACANVASLLLSRATTRRKELALRAALGAGRLRMIRQLLTESVGLALTGAAFGILLGAAALSIFKSLLPSTLPGLAAAAIDWQIVAAVTALAIFTGLASGLAPALSASQVDLSETMKTGSQRSTSSVWTRVRSVIIAGEVALTLVLLVSAGLLLRSLYKLTETNPGFDPAHILTIQISPNQSSCAKRAACIALYDRLLQRTMDIPGVKSAAIANSLPLDGSLPTLAVDVEGHPKTVDHPAPLFWFGAVSPDYFSTMHIPLLEGRYLTRSDGPLSSSVVVISAATAWRYWPNESAIGKHIKATDNSKWSTVVGIVGDVHQSSLSEHLPPFVPGAVYMPYAQSARQDGEIPAAMVLLAGVYSENVSVRAAIQHLAEDQDANVPVGRLQPLEEIASRSIADFRSTMRVFLSFAAAAILLAAIGIYGSMSYWVSQRTYEIGLRVALGATPQGILSLILGQGMKVTLYGIAGGIVAALLLTRFLTVLLYGVAATDALTFALVTVLVLAVAILATAFPAWRATRIDPLKSLRAE
ncbi:MAG TPA: ABC transporter permease [Bryobacteraceae bacterium]|nr:ABC transporter permease [Bryobacteraceae bacterium]